jgi:hypothetical protein
VTSWTHKVDSEDKEEHDFNNVLLEFRYAVEREDPTFVEYCERELGRMYRARGATKRSTLKAFGPFWFWVGVGSGPNGGVPSLSLISSE